MLETKRIGTYNALQSFRLSQQMIRLLWARIVVVGILLSAAQLLLAHCVTSILAGLDAHSDNVTVVDPMILLVIILCTVLPIGLFFNYVGSAWGYVAERRFTESGGRTIGNVVFETRGHYLALAALVGRVMKGLMWRTALAAIAVAGTLALVSWRSVIIGRVLNIDEETVKTAGETVCGVVGLIWLISGSWFLMGTVAAPVVMMEQKLDAKKALQAAQAWAHGRRWQIFAARVGATGLAALTSFLVLGALTTVEVVFDLRSAGGLLGEGPDQASTFGPGVLIFTGFAWVVMITLQAMNCAVFSLVPAVERATYLGRSVEDSLDEVSRTR